MVSSLLLLAASQLSPQAAKPVCQFDRPALLALGVDAFDQDLKGGWRVIANKKGCEDEAAELIQQYREQQEGSLSILYWHEGQLRAFVGQVGQAVSLFEKSKVPNDLSWNAYVDATIAFLVRDVRGLHEARVRLLATPKPEEGEWRDANGKPVPTPKWPMNIDVVNALFACFDKSYDEAYGTPQCRQLGIDAASNKRK